MLSVSTTDCLSQGEKQSQQHNSEERHVDSHHHHHLNAFFKGIYRAQKLVPSTVTVFPRVVPWFRVLAHGSLQCFPQLSDSVIAHTTTVRGFVLLCMHKSSVYIDTGCAQQQYKRRCCICEKSIYVLSSSAVLVL